MLILLCYKLNFVREVMRSIVEEKSMEFALTIIRMYNYLVSEKKEYVLSKQILRSGTSIGANIKESINAQSKADFIHKRFIALKEADETAYWLELLYKSSILNAYTYGKINSDLSEIIAMLTASIKTMKNT